MSRRPGGRRQRNALPRGHKVMVRLSDGELAVIATAAGRAGLSAGAYIGRARGNAGVVAAGGWPRCSRSAGTWRGCGPAPTPATGPPPGGWPGC